LQTETSYEIDKILTNERKTPYNKKYMIIAVSLLIAEFTARNNGGAARQESNPQSATTYISVR
jgi:hypothetical protein